MEPEICECCGAKMVKYWHTLNKPLCAALCKLYMEDKPVNISEILTHNQTCNFQKLKYFGFVAKSEEAGKWEITYLGERFCERRMSSFTKVQTYRGKVCQTSADNIYIDEIMKETYDKISEYIKTRVNISQSEQPSLFTDKAVI